MVVWSSMAAAGLLALSHLSFSGLVGASPMPGSKSAREMEAYDAASGDRLGAVASENHICSSAGIEMLERGGNAADAMVATVFCVGVIGMYHSGIGGGGFALVHTPNGTAEFIDFREMAPGAAFQDMYNNDTDLSLYGGLASGIPGEVRGLQHIHENYGSLPWEDLMQPAINVARYGWTVGADLVRYMASASPASDDFLVNDPQFAIDFAPNGTRVGLGDTITRKRYANTLEKIAKGGPDAFYHGEIAEATIRALQAANGTMTLNDLANYTVAIRETESVEFMGYKVTSTTAPSSGIVVLSALNILNGYDDLFVDGTLNLSTHRMEEAMRFGYGQRTELGDPYYVEGLDEYQASMISAETASIIRGKISDYQTLNVSAYDPDGIESLETPGTSHIVTADKSGLSLTLTTTVNLLFGSQLVVPETGVIMNDEMNDFSIPGSSNAFGYIPSEANYIRPWKRPLSSISPTIVTQKNSTKPYLITGSAGGSRIITATLQNTLHVLAQGMTAPEALVQPRLHDQLEPNYCYLEYTYNNETAAYLASLGHNISYVAPGQSTAQAIRYTLNGTFEAAGEPRQLDSGGFAV